MAPLTPTQTTRPHSSPKSPRTLRWLLYAALSLCIALLVASFLPSTTQEETQAAQSQSSSSSTSGSVVVEAGANPSDDELAAAEYLAKQGHRVRLLARNPASADPQPDAQLDDDDFPTEIKTVGNITSSEMSAALSRRIREGLSQAPSVVVDARTQLGLTKQVAEQAMKRALGKAFQDGRPVKRVHVIGPDGVDVNWDYSDDASPSK